MRYLSAVIGVMLLVLPASADNFPVVVSSTETAPQPPITVFHVAKCKIFTVSASPGVEWLVDRSLAKPGEYYVDSTKGTLVLSANKNGKYDVVAYVLTNGEFLYTHITIQVEDNPTPNPNPGPEPPTPPGPTPPNPPPAPVDEWLGKIQDAYKADVAASHGDKDQFDKMALAYAQGVAIASNTRLQKLGDIFNAEREAFQGVKTDSFPTVRKVIGDYIKTKLPVNPNTAVDDALRTQVQQTFKDVVTYLNATVDKT